MFEQLYSLFAICEEIVEEENSPLVKGLTLFELFFILFSEQKQKQNVSMPLYRAVFTVFALEIRMPGWSWVS